MNILLVEDNVGSANMFSTAMRGDYKVDTVRTGKAAIESAQSKNFDFIILDLGLPDIDGLEVCKTLRSSGLTSPIIVTSGDASIISKIKLIDSGADDYLVKPYSLGELKVRMRAQKRWRDHPSGSSVLTCGNLKLNTITRSVARGKRQINLQRKDFMILTCLLEHKGETVSTGTLTRFAWDSGKKPDNNTINVHLRHLRKLIDLPGEPQLIHTDWGIGYKIYTL